MHCARVYDNNIQPDGRDNVIISLYYKYHYRDTLIRGKEKETHYGTQMRGATAR